MTGGLQDFAVTESRSSAFDSPARLFCCSVPNTRLHRVIRSLASSLPNWIGVFARSSAWRLSSSSVSSWIRSRSSLKVIPSRSRTSPRAALAVFCTHSQWLCFERSVCQSSLWARYSPCSLSLSVSVITSVHIPGRGSGRGPASGHPFSSVAPHRLCSSSRSSASNSSKTACCAAAPASFWSMMSSILFRASFPQPIAAAAVMVIRIVYAQCVGFISYPLLSVVPRGLGCCSSRGRWRPPR